jgi:hypothetical protein
LFDKLVVKFTRSRAGAIARRNRPLPATTLDLKQA